MGRLCSLFLILGVQISLENQIKSEIRVGPLVRLPARPLSCSRTRRVTVSSGRRRDRPSRRPTTRSPLFRGAVRVRVPPFALHIEGNAPHALLCYARPAPDAPESQSPPVSSVLNACPRRVKSSLAFPHHRVSACARTGPGERPSHRVQPVASEPLLSCIGLIRWGESFLTW
jgi:hypothetical protein